VTLVLSFPVRDAPVKGELLFTVLCDYQQQLGHNEETMNPHELIVSCRVLSVQFIHFKLIAFTQPNLIPDPKPVYIFMT
jgi:hypothetical protein